MSYLTKPVVVAFALLLSQQASAASLCKAGLSGITLIEGNYDPPASMTPDTERFKPGGRWPDDLIEQGWHNLRKAHAPLRLVCRYKDGKQETVLLPNGTDACVLKPGLIINCK